MNTHPSILMSILLCLQIQTILISAFTTSHSSLVSSSSSSSQNRYRYPPPSTFHHSQQYSILSIHLSSTLVLQNSFFDNVFKDIFSNDKNDKNGDDDDDDDDDDTVPKKDTASSLSSQKETSMSSNHDLNDDRLSSEAWQKELTRRQETKETQETTSPQNKDENEDEDGEEEEEEEFDGYDLRDAIHYKFGYYFDMDFRPVTSLGGTSLYLNVMPFHSGMRQFRHANEYDYLCHLQAIVDILVKYDRLDYVLTQMANTSKMPRANTSPLVAVPFRLDLEEEDLRSILGNT